MSCPVGLVGCAASKAILLRVAGEPGWFEVLQLNSASLKNRVESVSSYLPIAAKLSRSTGLEALKNGLELKP